MVKVLGIDLAAQPERTGVVVLEIVAGRPSLQPVHGRASDDALVELAQAVDVVGVDAPLGWPLDFVAAVSAHERLEPWLGKVDRSEPVLPANRQARESVHGTLAAVRECRQARHRRYALCPAPRAVRR